MSHANFVGRTFTVMDYDGTMGRGSWLLHLEEELISTGIFPPDYRDCYRSLYDAWVKRASGPTYEKYINAVVKNFILTITGKTVTDVEFAAALAVIKHRDEVYRYTRAKVREARARGDVLIGLSHSPSVIVNMVSEAWDIDISLGSFYEVCNGVFTGVAASYDKAKALKQLVAQYGLTFEGSSGFGDTEADIEMLKLVVNPYFINPPEKVIRYAEAAGVPWVLERKDGITLHHRGTYKEIVVD